MGVNLKELIPPKARREVELRELKGKVIALDAYNALYQFLASIRQPDGTPLMDSRGRVTSHLSGLFYRTINLVENGIKPVYIFDGKPPELKEEEVRRRMEAREKAEKLYQEALKAGRLEEARRYAQMASRLTRDMVEDAKRLLNAMGIPWVQAPAEGEAQAAHLVKKGDAWAVGSQDYDSLLFGSPRLVRNLSITGKRKLPRRNVEIEVKPEIIELDKLLSSLGLTREQLVVIAMLIGTDYNPGGVKGFGPKKALSFVKDKDPAVALKMLPRHQFPVEPEEIYKYFLEPQVTDDYKVEWREPDGEAIHEILVSEHDFSEQRVKNAVERLKTAYRKHIKTKQLGLDMWFG